MDLHLKLLTISLSFYDEVISRGISLFLFHSGLKNVRSQRKFVHLQRKLHILNSNYGIVNYTTQ